MIVQDISLLAVTVPKIAVRAISRRVLETMKADIKLNGLQQPIIVKRGGNGRFPLMDGAYRVVACRELGHTKIQAIVKDEEFGDTRFDEEYPEGTL